MNALCCIVIASSTLLGQTPDKKSAAAAKVLESKFGGNVLFNEPGPDTVMISLSGSTVTDEALKEVAKIKNVFDLLVSKTGITDSGLENLKKCKKLNRIALLNNKSLTKDCVKTIVAMPSLNAVQLAGIKLNADAVKELAGTKNLKSLILNRTSLKDDDLKGFKGNKTITGLNLAGNEDIDGFGLANLHGMTQLRFVDIVGTTASIKEVKALVAALPKTEVRGKGTLAGNKKIAPPKTKVAE